MAGRIYCLLRRWFLVTCLRSDVKGSLTLLACLLALGMTASWLAWILTSPFSSHCCHSHRMVWPHESVTFSNTAWQHNIPWRHPWSRSRRIRFWQIRSSCTAMFDIDHVTSNTCIWLVGGDILVTILRSIFFSFLLTFKVRNIDLKANS